MPVSAGGGIRSIQWLRSECTADPDLRAPDTKNAIALDCSGELRNWNNCLLPAGDACKARGYTAYAHRGTLCRRDLSHQKLSIRPQTQLPATSIVPQLRLRGCEECPLRSGPDSHLQTPSENSPIEDNG